MPPLYIVSSWPLVFYLFLQHIWHCILDHVCLRFQGDCALAFTRVVLMVAVCLCANLMFWLRRCRARVWEELPIVVHCLGWPSSPPTALWGLGFPIVRGLQRFCVAMNVISLFPSRSVGHLSMSHKTQGALFLLLISSHISLIGFIQQKQDRG